MPPRIPILSSAFRSGLAALKMETPSAPLSTTAAPKALRDLSSSILNLDNNNYNNDNNNPSPNSTSNNPSGSSNGYEPTMILGQIYRNIKSPRLHRPKNAADRQQVQDMLRGQMRHEDFMRQLPRRWRAGDVYAPHDLSPSEMTKWRKNTARKRDLVDLLGLRPLDMYRNFSVMSEFMTPHGRIKRSVETGLRPVNQRKMAKAIRRSIGLGLHPSVHHHPELLMRGPNKVPAQHTATGNKWLRLS